ncbi:ACT domain-containing protein [Tundrisphaera lichenicola]|uniref:ACT domain-containing protein n=1 Tax=Tundrisphaera lichenicola TaxID=2029860 RepID=UPI003EB7C326
MMEFVHEITAYLENKPGRLAKICSALAHEKVDLRALSVMDANGRSVLRFVTDQGDTTRKVLTSLGTEYSGSEVLAAEMENRPGALARFLERLAEEHINVEYAYSAASHTPGRSLGIFHTSNPKRAMQLLVDSAGTGSGNSPQRRPLHSR